MRMLLLQGMQVTGGGGTRASQLILREREGGRVPHGSNGWLDGEGHAPSAAAAAADRLLLVASGLLVITR